MQGDLQVQLVDIGLEVFFFLVLASIILTQVSVLWTRIFDDQPSSSQLLIEGTPEESLDRTEAEMVGRGFIVASCGNRSVTFHRRVKASGGLFLALLLLGTMVPTLYMLLAFVDFQPAIEPPPPPTFGAEAIPEPATAEPTSPVEFTGLPRDLGSATGWFVLGLLPVLAYFVLLVLRRKQTTVSVAETEEGWRLLVASDDTVDRSLVHSWATRTLAAKRPRQ
jgi:hypothetical protein